jgi:hypothetical protein
MREVINMTEIGARTFYHGTRAESSQIEAGKIAHQTL